MPIVNTWIRDEDYSKYLVVKNKGKGAWPAFIHDALNGTNLVVDNIKEMIKPNIIKTPEDAQKALRDDNSQSITKAQSARKKG